MSTLFGFYDLGLRALSAAQAGMQVAGDNISNVNTPGFARRRLEFVPGPPIQMKGGSIDQGVEIGRLRRMEDTLLLRTLEKEQGSWGEADERLRGLRDVETLMGTVDGEGILSAMGRFSQAFSELAGQPESLALRRGAVSSAESLASLIRDTHEKLRAQQRLENDAIANTVDRINSLASRLAEVNNQIREQEVAGDLAAGSRDQQEKIVKELAELSGGTAVRTGAGKIAFYLAGGHTLVTGDEKSVDAILLETTKRGPLGQIRILAGADGSDITSKIRGGRLSAMVDLRDNVIGEKIADLDTVASELIRRVNALTTGAVDLDGNPGSALFQSDPPFSRPAASIRVDPAILSDPRLLAVSATGAPGDGSAAMDIAEIPGSPSGTFGNRSMTAFLADSIARVGSQVTETEIRHSVAGGIVEELEVRRDSISAVNLDEEAVELMKFQSAYQAAARFMQALNEMTEITVNLV
jgi:flagellar hook-associated protein 1 FlgK